MKHDNIKKIKANKRSIFNYWLDFLKPFHKLKPKEMEALGCMLYYRHTLSLVVHDPVLVDRLLFSSDTRAQIMKDLGNMDHKVFNNLLSSMRKRGVISKDNKILPALIPKMDSKDGFRLVFDFEPIIDETK